MPTSFSSSLPRLLQEAVVALALAASGCASGAMAEVPSSHPASPLAEEAPVVRTASASTDAVSPPHAHPPADGAAVYACPMHPEVTSASPGSCPKCGMSLRPKAP